MKKVVKFFINSPVWILFVLICVVFLPKAIIAEPQSRTKLIIRAIGIDKTDEGYEASAIAFIPRATQTFSENYKIVEAEGKTLLDALNTISTEAGKEVALAHAGVVFVNDKACENGLVETLDYLVRDYSLGNDTFVVYVSGTSKDMVRQTQKLVQNSGIKIEEISRYDNDKIIINNSDIETIYSSAFSKSRCALLNVIELGNEGLEASPPQGETNGESGGEQGSQNQDKQGKKILNSGKALVIKDGKKQKILDKNQTSSLKLTNSFSNGGLIRLEDFSDENFKNSTITLSITKNKTKTQVFFKNGQPFLRFIINPKCQIAEVYQKEKDDDIYVRKRRLGSREIEIAINAKIKREVSSILDYISLNNLDVVKAFEKFDSNCHKEFENFLLKLENKDDYLKHINFEVECFASVS